MNILNSSESDSTSSPALLAFLKSGYPFLSELNVEREEALGTRLESDCNKKQVEKV